jgi:pimeloyl-ACP methyl ester carboxylesterase
MSVTGFMVHYIHYLDPFKDATDQDQRPEQLVLILAGYSYGAMITTQIPPLEQILGPFSRPAVGSSEAEIRLRAQHLAEQQNTVLASVREIRPLSPGGRQSPRRSMGMRVGGNETDEIAHETRTSFSAEAEEKIRKGITELLARTKLGHKQKHSHETEGHEQGEGHEPPEPAHLDQVSDLVVPRVAYVLISPLQGVITHLATMSFMPSASSLLSKIPGRSQNDGAPPKPPDPDEPAKKSADADLADLAERKLVQHPTLAAFGDNDVFVPAHKLRAWAKRLQQAEGSRFHAVEISSAGHFWVEEKVLYKLRDLVVEFSSRLINGK